MVKFTVKVGSGLNFDFPVRYLIIDSITDGKSLRLRSMDSDLDIDLTVRGGGKISQMPELVSRWRFDNYNAIDVDVIVQGGSVFYDENRLEGSVSVIGDVTISGDVNALTRFDNLTKYENQFVGGFSTGASIDNYTYIGLYNPVGSNVISYLNRYAISAFGQTMSINTINETDYLANVWVVDATWKNKNIGGVVSKTKKLYIDTPVTIGEAFIDVSSDANGTPFSMDFQNSPIRINEGTGILFYPKVVNNQNTTMLDFYEE